MSRTKKHRIITVSVYKDVDGWRWKASMKRKTIVTSQRYYTRPTPCISDLKAFFESIFHGCIVVNKARR